jgi:hypothetical protein
MKITVRTSARVRIYPADAVLSADGFLPSVDAVKTASTRIRCVHADTNAKNKIKIKNKKIVIIKKKLVVGKERKKMFSFRFSIPKIPELRGALRAKPREEEGFFGLVPLVTHPSSILLLGCLTPKFLSLSLHSL